MTDLDKITESSTFAFGAECKAAIKEIHKRYSSLDYIFICANGLDEIDGTSNLTAQQRFEDIIEMSNETLRRVSDGTVKLIRSN